MTYAASDSVKGAILPANHVRGFLQHFNGTGVGQTSKAPRDRILCHGGSDFIGEALDREDIRHFSGSAHVTRSQRRVL